MKRYEKSSKGKGKHKKILTEKPYVDTEQYLFSEYGFECKHRKRHIKEWFDDVDKYGDNVKLYVNNAWQPNLRHMPIVRKLLREGYLVMKREYRETNWFHGQNSCKVAKVGFTYITKKR